MINKKLSPEELEAVRAEAAELVKDYRVCHCGTCNDAIGTGLKLVAEMVDNDCPLWAMQVAYVVFYAGGMVAAGATDQLGPNSSITRDFINRLAQAMSANIAVNEPRFHALRDKVADFKKSRVEVQEFDDIEALLKALFS